jgi:hypothetical protein
MWVSQQSSTKPGRLSPRESSWQFSVPARQVLWLGVILALLAQCALAISLPSWNAYAPTWKPSEVQAAGSQATTAAGTGNAWMNWTSGSESKR